GGEGEGGGVEDRVRGLPPPGRPPGDLALPSGGEMELQAVPPQRGHAAPALAATATAATTAIVAAVMRAATCAHRWKPRWRRRSWSGCCTLTMARTGTARAAPTTTPTTAPSAAPAPAPPATDPSR